MRTLVCGDIHCKPHFLARALGLVEWNKFVFLGDACDDWGATQEDNIQIIKHLIELKNTYGEKFIWLLGNHDWGYYDDTIRMSGHIHAGSANVGKLLEDNTHLWELFHSDGNVVYSHAGISREFLMDLEGVTMRDLKHNRGINNPLNRVGRSCGGSDPHPSLIWARPEEVTPPPKEIIKCQVVGHTPVRTITKINDLIVCDTMSRYSNGEQFGDCSLLLIEDNKKFVLDWTTGKVINELED